MHEKIKWGIIGTGQIATKFATALAVLDDAELTAVASRSQEKANAFAERHGAATAYGSYEELADDPEVQAVYVGTPHVLHKANALLCMDAGKAVLCEKPFAMNAGEVEEMIACARKHDVFLMEAMWTWFFPAMAKVRELIANGAVGEVQQSRSTFCFRSGVNPEGRLFNPALGGGALLDVGVYTTAFAHMVHGTTPQELAALADIGETHVDEQTAVIQKYPNGALSMHTSACRTNTEHTAEVYGTDGWIEIPAMFWQPRRIILHKGGESETFEYDVLGNGMTYEVMEVMNCLRSGKKESEVIPLATSLEIMQTLDRIRDFMGLTYPADGNR